MKTKLLVLFVILLGALTSFSQVNYLDVAVIVNDNDASSTAIGEYFMQKRNIPANNMVHIQCPSVELIDSAGFENIRQQVEEKFISQGLKDKVTYIVTTKGIPFNVRLGDNCDGLDGVKYCSSFDSEIGLIFSEWSDQILGSSTIMNPYFQQDEHYGRSKYGFYLVTRLDGYTVDDVKAMIDRSGPGIEVDKKSAQFIIDFSYVTDTIVKDLFSDFVEPAVNFLVLSGWHCTFDPDDDLITNQSDVLGYFNINYQPSNKVLDFGWLKGSISEIALSTGNLTFNKEGNVFNELSVPDLIEEGATSSSTYVNSTFFSKLVQLPLLYQRYLNESIHPAYNLAESYFMAIPSLSSQYLVIGDPKTSLVIQQNNTGEESNYPELVLYPNPATDQLHVVDFIRTEGQYRLSIKDMTGRIVYSKDIYYDRGLTEEVTDISGLPGGIYFISISGPGNDVRSMKFIKTGGR